MNKKEKKASQLGMNPSSAYARLTRDLLFDFAVKAGHTCFRCKEPLTRGTFSVEHVEPWLDSSNPLEKFFDLDNVAYSHLSCNSKHTSRLKYITPEAQKQNKLRINRESQRRSYTPEKRRATYLRTGQ